MPSSPGSPGFPSALVARPFMLRSGGMYNSFSFMVKIGITVSPPGKGHLIRNCLFTRSENLSRSVTRHTSFTVKQYNNKTFLLPLLCDLSLFTELPQFMLLLNKPNLQQSQSKVLIYHISLKDTKHYNIKTQQS